MHAVLLNTRSVASGPQVCDVGNRNGARRPTGRLRPSAAASQGAGMAENTGAVVETVAFTKYYGPRRRLEDLTLSVARRGLELPGPERAGKSTTIRLMLDFTDDQRAGAPALVAVCGDLTVRP